MYVTALHETERSQVTGFRRQNVCVGVLTYKQICLDPTFPGTRMRDQRRKSR